jgi:hypothetical protein
MTTDTKSVKIEDGTKVHEGPDFGPTLRKPPPMSNIGLLTFLRTYARAIDPTKPHGTVETWTQTLERVVRACNTQLKA